jgi:uncharacterized protein
VLLTQKILGKQMKKIVLGLAVLVALVSTIIFMNKPVTLNDLTQNNTEQNSSTSASVDQTTPITTEQNNAEQITPVQSVETNKLKPKLESLKEKALKGDSKAQNDLGNMYANGSATGQSDKEALKWFEQSANQGYAEAQYNLGTMYQNAIGVDQDLKKAAMYYRLAANQGHKEAKVNLEVLCQQDSTLCN